VIDRLGETLCTDELFACVCVCVCVCVCATLQYITSAALMAAIGPIMMMA